ncbi:hypothetical protein K469DRAFT_719167 [Zopfia rhizophila CBS 207.26]|uniref:Clr5 domain-containing protein n=1 Tax=Zopfia rhizophila CBS 207.26 TaxID=1314779 RepID=A0A6A6EPQ9_9PEZI|nr:hypothetical protein K469DRAFT_719167 [Zopfia rhizophila CBS 207.26]
MDIPFPQPSLVLDSANENHWEHLKPTSKQLYLIEDKPLSQVIELMKTSYGFNATTFAKT